MDPSSSVVLTNQDTSISKSAVRKYSVAPMSAESSVDSSLLYRFACHYTSSLGIIINENNREKWRE